MQTQRATIRRDVSLEPYTTLRRGETGVVVHKLEDADGIYEADIRMDKYHKGLARWDNEAHLVFPELENVSFTAQAKSSRFNLGGLRTLAASVLLGAGSLTGNVAEAVAKLSVWL